MLRTGVLVAILQVLIVPLQHLYNRFIANKNATDRKLDISGNVQYLQKALNDAFYLENEQIYIVSGETADKKKYLHFAEELQPSFWMYSATEHNKAFLSHEYEISARISFIVMVPTFLCTSTESKDLDEYEWKYLNTIKDLLNEYKPAGRTFSINLYDYE